jgi:hypothetical protein
MQYFKGFLYWNFEVKYYSEVITKIKYSAGFGSSCDAIEFIEVKFIIFKMKIN